MPKTSTWQIAADSGGTFTDCHALAPDGTEQRVKVLSSGCLRTVLKETVDGNRWLLRDGWDMPADFFRGFLLRRAGAGENAGGNRVAITFSESHPESMLVCFDAPWSNPPETGMLVELTTDEAAPVLGARLLTRTAPGALFPPMRFRLATTRATNALLERKGSRTALFITEGFGDLLRIGDQRRKDLFALRHEELEVHHETVCEITERLDAGGHELQAVEEAPLREQATRMANAGIRTAAVALLHSDLNGQHEQMVREILMECGFTHVSLSSELAPFVRILPRAQSAVANAYLTGPVEQFIKDVGQPLDKNSSLSLMTSAGAIEPAERIRPKDLLLSGPAAGVLGALNAARWLGYTRVITFDMGGTSTDVARLDGAAGYRFHQQVGGMTLLTPSVAIETVAAGGGSICAWTPSGLTVGPHSAGAEPGPACYGKGGPLTITDVNLLLGRFDPVRAPIPLSREAAEARLGELLEIVNSQTERALDREALLQHLLELATEHMADAIRRISVLEGYDPAEYALLAFGGAGPQHACDVAERLGIQTILAPRHAGILSAVGLQEALPERFAQRQVLRLLDEVREDLPELLRTLVEEATRELAEVANQGAEIQLRQIAEVRLRGQDTPLQIEFTHPEELHGAFSRQYEHLFGYALPASKPVEIVSLRVVARPAAQDLGSEVRSSLVPTRNIHGPELVQDAFSTLVIGKGWSGAEFSEHGWVLHRSNVNPSEFRVHSPAPASLDLMRHRFTSVVEEMGALLRRTALSTNIRERLDFSCALLDPAGRLISSAPHIPVHLGALGMCVREVMKVCGLQEGDTIITNHPAFGGSHLPDVTLITPVFSEGEMLGFVANRAHHAEIGGLSPGSMPANATRLIEEGVVIAPTHLSRKGVANFETVRRLLEEGPHPTRAVEDNIADLHAQLAANRLGAERLLALMKNGKPAVLRAQMQGILDESRAVMRRFMETIPEGSAQELLDDGATLCVKLDHKDGKLVIDFNGTARQHAGNLNATPAIVRSAALYVLRLVLNEDLPLNEGLLEDVEILLSKGSFLNPIFHENPAQCPAVVGGNVEVSQRVVDTLLKALGTQACSQGTMNNFLFGNERFGYYETIGGGAGAGEGYDGASALHTHMTNTAITDPEIIERRYPVRVREFSVRTGSGGAGRWKGGDGMVREFEFLEPLTVSLLTQHRSTRPYGMEGGAEGSAGKQTLIKADGTHVELPSSATVEVQTQERLRLETPGGGGWG